MSDTVNHAAIIARHKKALARSTPTLGAIAHRAPGKSSIAITATQCKGKKANFQNTRPSRQCSATITRKAGDSKKGRRRKNKNDKKR